MTQPAVTIIEIDGALGVIPASAGSLTAFVGSCTKGEIGLPVTFARVPDLVAYGGDGPLIEAAAYYISVTGRPVMVSRAEANTTAVIGAVTHVGTGTATMTLAATGDPADDFQLVIRIEKGGTAGTAGVSYRYSYDGGRTYGALQQLGTLMTITFDNFTWTIAAGTLVTGDTYAAVLTAPQWDSTTLPAALTGLGDTTVAWEQLVVVGALDPDSFDALELTFAGWRERGKFRSWMASARVPDYSTESEAEYLATLSTQFGEKETTLGSICAGACRVTSGVSGRKYRRPVVFALAAAQAVSEEIDTADVNLGSLTGVSIRDVNGNLEEHDESANPGLDDARFTVLRTWDGYPGVYINRPRIFSAPGSDFTIIPYRRVLNLSDVILRDYFVRRLNRPIRVDPKTGFILEVDAVEIQGGANAALRAGLMAKPKASGVQFVLSRTDNVLSTKTLHGTARVLPLAYPEWIEVENGFYNPALAVAA